VTTLRQHIDDLDIHTWATLTKRTAERAVAAAVQVGQEPPAPLAAVAAMSEAELIENSRKNVFKPKRPRPTSRMKLIEAEHQRAMAQQRAATAEQDKEDAVADAAAARAEARESSAAAEAARERARAALEELARKEVQRTTEQRETRAELDSLRDQLTQARAEATGARADAQESAAAAAAAKDREGAALDEFARQGAQRVGERREAQAALEKSQADVERLRVEFDEFRADAGAQIAAAVEQASAAEARAEQRLVERAEERRDAQAEMERLHGEIEAVRAHTNAEIAAADERARAAQDRAEHRLVERAADRVSAQKAIEQLQTHLEATRAHAAAEVDGAREQAALAIAAAQEGMDETIARVRAEARQQVDEALQDRARAEAEADRARGLAQTAQPAGAHGLTIPIPGWEVRPATRRIENALTALHQINYVLEVGMAEEVEAEIPVDAELVRSLARTVQWQAEGLGQEFAELADRFSADSQVEAAARYAAAAAAACEAFLRRIGTAAQQLRHRDASPDADVIAAVMAMLADPHVQELVPEPAGD
jgi:colicin import membrane protein